MKKKKECLILGLALFAMFFGAGNLIFPPSIGLNVGNKWYIALLGFFITGIGLPLLGIIAFNNVGNLNNFADKISYKFNRIYCSLLILTLGPLLAIPRTGATTFELGIIPNFPMARPVIVIGIYFFLTLIMVLNPSKIIDNIGKFLTPVILLMLSIIIIKGIFFKIGTPIKVELIKNPFSFGFLEGYQTMDALGSILMGAVIVSELKIKGYTDRKTQRWLLVRAAFIAAFGLSIVYGGLLYLGATTSSIVSGMKKTSLIVYITTILLGDIGTKILGICVSAACLTTSIGLTTIVGNYFSTISKFSYKSIVTLTCIFSSIVAISGIESIIKISIPILTILYPTTIILIILNLFKTKKVIIYQISVVITLITSFVDVGYKIFKIDELRFIFNIIPFSNDGFIWLVPVVIIVPVIVFLYPRILKNKINYSIYRK